MEIQEFSPAKAEIQAAVLEVEGLTIKGIEDEAGYEAVKAGKKKLADYRIRITKFGKEQREEALAWQREVLRQEKELLAMIEPTETDLKGKLEAVDEEKKRKEREVLLPARVKMLEEVGVKLLDAEILQMDEKSFSAYFTEKKIQYLEMQENKRKQEEEANKRAEEIEKAKAETEARVKKEIEEKAEREKKEAEQKIINENARIAREAVEKEKAEKAEARRLKKNQTYKDWLKENGVNDKNIQDFNIVKEEQVNNVGTKFTLYKKISEITIV